jgi:predicted deacylase
MNKKSQEKFIIGGVPIPPGKSAEVSLPLSRLVTGNQMVIPLKVFHGKQRGPTMWVSSGIHGDEIQGVEIIRRLMAQLDCRRLAGTVIMVPIINVFGFLSGDRYLPDRRDLNRSFPGSAKGSLAGQIAQLFMTEIVQRCDLGIDLHTGSDGRSNLPQIRADMENPELKVLAKAFGAPVMLHSRVRDGSLREAAAQAGTKILLFEGGEANRFNEQAIVMAVQGIGRILQHLGMHPWSEAWLQAVLDEAPLERSPVFCEDSSWIRAKKSGILQVKGELGARVAKGEELGLIYDDLGHRLSRVNALVEGIIIGRSETPLVNRGDALFHIAQPKT